MSEQTQIIDESNELLQEAPVNPRKSKSKAGAAIAAGAAAGVGAIAYDAYAGDDTKKDETTGGVPSADNEEKSDSTSSTVPADTVIAENNPVQDSIPAGQPDVLLIPDHLSIVNAPDDMSFNEAFAWSREKAGPAQLFEWKGELYHTCHPNEYAALPQEMKEIFQDMWLDNAFGYSEPPAEGYMVSYDYETGPAVEEVTEPTEPTTDSTATDPTVVAEQDSVSMDSDEYDIVYTQEDYDSDFEGLDEWVNPEDIA
ncbi:hypothetical protein SAMN05216327_103268 [Dyadobacter sp. SG02]|uniref:hypothetical protein n=1 Tax=Dyadobacter sp. SG02 TaxID=1855291 RepID=UPI0008C36FA1|nr:hypothetical protein [Dyadobacter sp. SG02]SEI69061.1 hypothetical protein SAMN05216327_103268 [Dyadobacter sp. SG02]